MIQHISDRVAVMYLGEIVELADRDELYENHRHPYTKALMSAIPVPDPDIEMERERIILRGTIPSSSNPPPGCFFHTRCPCVENKCRELKPDYVEISKNHYCACHYAKRI
jgi:peptide/nickel transport system ATP-binding protein/oligopeptide transport system ATP-binding protein